MTTPTHEENARAALRRVVQDKEAPNGIAPDDCGPWSDIVAEVYAAHSQGHGAVLSAFNAAAKIAPDLIRLLADDPKADAWPAPIPLDSAPVLPEFPADVLPAWLREFVTAEAEALQVPIDMPGMLSLAVLGTALGRVIDVCPRPDWREPLNCYTLIALPPGSRKSGAFRDMTAPIRKWEADQARDLAPVIDAAERSKRILEAKLKAAEDQAAKAKGADSDAARREADRLATELAGLRIETVPRLFSDDVTMEPLVSLLCEHGGRFAVLSAEPTILSIASGRYSSTPSYDPLLKAHAGDTIRVDRRGRPSEFIDSPALTIGVCIQPERLRQLAATPTFKESGLTARFWYSLPVNTVGRRNVTPPPVPSAVRHAYDQHVAALLDIEPAVNTYGAPEAHRLAFGREAHSALVDFMWALEPRLGPEGDLVYIADWAAKLAGAVVRVAGQLHVADAPANWQRPIAADTVTRAIRVGEYLLQHALAAFEGFGYDPDLECAKTILAWLQKERPATFTRSDCLRGVRSLMKGSQLDAPLGALEERGYIRRLPPPAVKRRGPVAEVFECNPAALQGKGGRHA